MSYDPKAIEAKWQKRWEAERSFAAVDDDAREKFFVLVEFPYPSGDGLHVGHCRSYTALDIVARKKRMEGRNVLFPIGFDAFGLPTENYAIKHGIQPRVATDKNIANFTRQLKAMGFSFDWERVVDTTDPAYFKWTQWIFLEFWRRGLAYQAEMAINWCPRCKIGLANEEVVNGGCERCGAPTERRQKKQWMLAITKYAERLLNDLETVDFLPKIKAQQQNWIGRSEGTAIDFVVDGSESVADFCPGSDAECQQLFLLTWNTVTGGMNSTARNKGNALSSKGGIHSAANELNDPEHPSFTPGEKLIDTPAKAETILRALRKAEASASEEFKIIEAVVTENHVHAVVWVSDEAGGLSSVLKRLKGVSSRRFWQAFPSPSNGGINSAVRNERSTKTTCNHLWRSGFHFAPISHLAGFEGALAYLREHATKHTLAKLYSELREKITVFTTRADTLFGVTYVVLAPEHALVDSLRSQITNWSEVEDYRATAAKKSDLERTELAKEKTGVELSGVSAIHPLTNERVPVFVADYVLAGYGTGAVMAVPAHDERDFEFRNSINKKAGREVLKIQRVVEPAQTHPMNNEAEIKNSERYFVWLGEIRDNKIPYTSDFEDSYLINSGEFNNLNPEEARIQITAKLESIGAGSKTVNFKLRDWVFSRQRYWGEPIPLVHCPKCGVVPLPESELPLTLPEVERYEPTDTGESPLAAIESWVNTTCPNCGEPAKRETDTMPNWAGSSWYFLRYTDPLNAKALASSENLKYWTPVDLYNGGMEHTVLHLLYSRFWHKFLHDCGITPTPEPYKKRISHGMILAGDGEKMSKSRGNVVNPDEIVERLGADTLRVYEMFIGPFDQAAPWSDAGVSGCRRFLEKVWRLCTEKRLEPKPADACPLSATPDFRRTLNQMLKKVTDDVDGFRFNTAVAAMMEFVNFCTSRDALPQPGMEKFLRVLSVFAPHLAEELWERLGHTTLLAHEPWPAVDEKWLVADTVTLAVQVNGKLRGTLEVAAGIAKDEAIRLARENENVGKWLEGKEVVKEVWVPDKIVGFVIK